MTNSTVAQHNSQYFLLYSCSHQTSNCIHEDVASRKEDDSYTWQGDIANVNLEKL